MKPLGYWLVHIHQLIENNFERLLTGDALSRRHWQVLNTIAAKPGSLAEIEQAMAHFHDDVRPLIRDFTDRGWVTPEYELTAAGREAYDRIAAQVHAERAKVLDGVSPEEYATLMNLLERIATNAATPV
ncbi:DNA-binding MarR family transcriptional regulator [Kibdelosporangium banguiense]|uniref:DNA-binding MarR family transcriptional regulator n=1 Tax=Kibdelosporangium banguiense TaxID=1365924 RepID=A0ABS4TBU2_9PSEU|nr:MarR family winged helix-turn-helix transcriptional regulator [Kibdelosporangium banguiense]MBP2321883.1 DNA-binding MarR family transcriptional regulator [Kibdelosporangium banguiense]